MPSLRVVTAAKAMPVSMTCFSTPSSPHRKSRCHQERRNSPSVIDCRPTASCFVMMSSMVAVFDRFQLGGAEFTLGVALARGFERGRTQQAADMVGAERRLGSLSSLVCSFSSCHGPRRRPSSNHRPLSRLLDRPPSRTMTVSVPTPHRRSRRSYAALPIPLPRPKRCPPRSRRNRIAATGRADRCRRISRLVRCAF